MSLPVKWGLITGAVVAGLGLCGGGAIGVYYSCCALFVVLGGAALGSYLALKDDTTADRTKNGAIAGAIVGGGGLIGQTLGGVIGTLFSASLYALIPELAQNNPLGDPATMGAVGIGANVGVGLCVGAILTGLAAGVGALMAGITGPKASGAA